jgi:hypothetical protein
MVIPPSTSSRFRDPPPLPFPLPGKTQGQDISFRPTSGINSFVNLKKEGFLQKYFTLLKLFQ